PHQQLTAGGDGAPLLPAAPAGGGELARLLGEQGQNFVRFLIGGLPQDQRLGAHVHVFTLPACKEPAPVPSGPADVSVFFSELHPGGGIPTEPGSPGGGMGGSTASCLSLSDRTAR